MAITGLLEVAEECGDRQLPRSYLLRLALAFLYQAGNARADREWVYRQFWQTVTSAPQPQRPFDSDFRRRDATIAINGILHDLGWETTPQMFEDMRRPLRQTGK